MSAKLKMFYSRLQSIWIIIFRCRNWLPVIIAKLGLNPKLSRVDFWSGMKIVFDPPLDSPGTWPALFDPAISDCYQVDDIDAELIIDVGGNIGAFCCLAAFKHQNSKVVVFEPQQSRQEILQTNIKANNLTNVTLRPTAVTCDGRIVSLFVDQENLAGASLYGAGTGITETYQLKSETLEATGIFTARSVFIKLDCEGAESEIVPWLMANKGKLPQLTAIHLETHSFSPLSGDELSKLLFQSGFHVEQKTHKFMPYIRAHRLAKDSK